MNDSNEKHDASTWREMCYEVLEEDGGLRLDQFLNIRMVWRSRSSIQKLIDEDKVRLQGGRAGESGLQKKASKRVKTGEIYSVTLPRPKRELESVSDLHDLEIPVLYEDNWILAVDKPAGIPVHPGGQLMDRTVISLLNDRYRTAGGSDETPLKLCHRLDLETSGVLLIGKDPVVQPKFSALFEHRKVDKEYLALVHGEMEKETGEIELPIGPAKDSGIHLKRGVNFKKGQPARTGFTVEKRIPGFTLVRLKLYTGRHHQLRVHLSAVGHPIVGDKAYGLDEKIFIRYHENQLTEEDRERLIFSRQALHAARLTLTHAVLGKKITFEAPLPREIDDFIKKMC